MKSIIGILLLSLPMFCMAQGNLVPNGSFEEYTACPTTISQIHLCEPWYNPTGASPDYFNVCSEPEIFPTDTIPRMGVPENRFGYQLAKDGDAYIGIYGAQFSNQEEVRDYVQIELLEPLHHSVRYLVKFYASISESSRYAISTIGAHLSSDVLISSNLLAIDVMPQVLSDAQQPIMDTTAWELITDTVVSRDGGERYLTIGNFFSDSESDTTFFNPNPPSGHRYAYYYIDDVSVVALDSVPDGIEELNELGLEVWPNPVQEVLRFSVGDSHGRSSLGMTDIRIRVLDAVGREVTLSSALGGHSPLQGGEPLRLNVSALPPGIYFLELATENGTRAVRKFVKE